MIVQGLKIKRRGWVRPFRWQQTSHDERKEEEASGSNGNSCLGSTSYTMTKKIFCSVRRLHLKPRHREKVHIDHEASRPSSAKKEEQKGIEGQSQLDYFSKTLQQLEDLAKEACISELAYFVEQVAAFQQLHEVVERGEKYQEIIEEFILPQATLFVGCISRSTRKQLLKLAHFPITMLGPFSLNGALSEVLLYCLSHLESQHGDSAKSCIQKLQYFLLSPSAKAMEPDGWESRKNWLP